jgi:aryl-alcohol dehydrogenase-like predicted oxidoreductase
MTLPKCTTVQKSLVLGTALWAWGIDRKTAFCLLDNFTNFGGKIIDTAANYPINKNPNDFGVAVKWISEWISINPGKQLYILIKVGATDNLGSSNINLLEKNIIDSVTHYKNLLGDSLQAISIHWDNRGDNDIDLIKQTVLTMATLSESELSIGFSGVQRPDLYLKTAPQLADKWWIQVKENITTNTARLFYQKYFPNAHYLAYGINMGGLKDTTPTKKSSMALRGINYSHRLAEKLSKFLHSHHGLKPAPKNLNELALALSYINPYLSGIIIGPRNLQQLNNTMEFWNQLDSEPSNEYIAVLESVIKDI